MIYPDNMFYDYLYEANSVKRTTNNNDKHDRSTDYDWVNNLTDEDIEALFDNHNYDCDRDDTNCECEDNHDCECEDDHDCECEDDYDGECGDDCDCMD